MNFSRDMKNLKNRRKGKAGFTMSELLIVVAIVIVLFAVAVLSLVTIQKNLRQKELDSKAEILTLPCRTACPNCAPAATKAFISTMKQG